MKDLKQKDLPNPGNSQRPPIKQPNKEQNQISGQSKERNNK